MFKMLVNIIINVNEKNRLATKCEKHFIKMYLFVGRGYQEKFYFR